MYINMSMIKINKSPMKPNQCRCQLVSLPVKPNKKNKLINEGKF